MARKGNPKPAFNANGDIRCSICSARKGIDIYKPASFYSKEAISLINRSISYGHNRNGGICQDCLKEKEAKENQSRPKNESIARAFAKKPHNQLYLYFLNIKAIIPRDL